MTTPSIEAMVVKYTRLIHPQDLGEETSKLENILRQALIESTNAGKDEAVEKIEKYFKGLIFIPDPQATKDNLIKSLQDKK